MSEGMARPLIVAHGISLSRDGQALLEHVDLAVAAGEVVTLIGPNGAGKTTLLRILLGLERPDRGAIDKVRDLVIGYVPQALHIDPALPLTVERFLGLAPGASPAAVRASLAEVGAPQVARQAIQEISGGELQRVMLARALICNPRLLILDEPVQGVDFAGQLQLYGLIGRIRDRRRCGILMVSHDLHLVMSATDRVVCLNRHVCCSGTPEAVSADPAYVALFGQRAVAELAVYHHHHDHRHGPAGEVIPLDHGQPS
jgi:zinc transport system ATP-binding protein